MAKLVWVELKLCRQVCRKWKRLIHSPEFMQLWKPSPALLLRVRTLDKKSAAKWRLMRDKDPKSALGNTVAMIKSITDQAWDQGRMSSLESPMFPEDKNITIHASAKGLMLFSTNDSVRRHFYVCNPLTGALKELPRGLDRYLGESENVQMSVKEGVTIAMFYHRLGRRKIFAWYKSGKWTVDKKNYMEVKGTLIASDISSFLVGYVEVQADNSRNIVTAAYNRVWHAVVTPQAKLPPPTKGGFDAWSCGSYNYKFFSFNGCFKLAIGYADELVLCRLNLERGLWEEEFRCELHSYNPAEVPSLLVEGCSLVACYKYNSGYHGLAPLVIFNLETRNVQPLQNSERHGKCLRKDMEMLGIFTPTLWSIP